MREPESIRQILDEFGDEIMAEFMKRLQEMQEKHEKEVAELRLEAEARRDVLDIPAAARVLSVSPKTVQRRIAEGRLPYFRVGGDKGVRVERSELMKAARAGFPKLRGGRSRLHSRPHFPGSATVLNRTKETLPSETELA